MSPNPLRRTLVRNTVWNYGAFVANVAVNLVLFPFVVHRIGDAAAGLWLLLSSLVGYLGLLGIGVVPAVGVFVAGPIARGESAVLSRYASTALACLSGLGLLPLLAIPALPFLTGRLQLEPSLQAVAVEVLALTLVSFALQVPGHLFNAVLGAAQRQDRCSQVWMFSLAAKLIGIVLVLRAGLGLVAMVRFELALVVATDLVFAVLTYRAVPQLRLSPRAVSRGAAVELYRYGGLLFVGGVCRRLIEESDRLVVAAFLPVAAVTYYSSGFKIFALSSALVATLASAIAPVAAAFSDAESDRLVRPLVVRATKYTAAIAWPLAIVIGANAELLLSLWIDPSFARHALVTQILLLGFVSSAVLHPARSVLAGRRRVAGVVWAYDVPQAVLNLGLSLWLVRSWGIAGVASGTTIPALLLAIGFWKVVRAELGLTLGELWREAWAPVLGPLSVSFLPVVVARLALPPGSRAVAALAILGSLVFVALFWRRSLDDRERHDVVRLVVEALGPVSRWLPLKASEGPS